MAVATSRAETAIPGSEIENYFNLRMWETADGILPTSVRSIAQTTDGYVWLAAQDSIVRFDGTRAVSFSQRNTQVLQNPLRALEAFVDRTGRLWCSTTDGKLYAFENGRWREFAEAQGWSAAPASGFSESAEGKLIFSAGTKLLTFSDGKFSEIALPFTGEAFRAIFSRDGTLWACSTRELWYWENSKWHQVGEPLAGLPGSLCASGTQGIWVAQPAEVRMYHRKGLQKTLARPADFQSEKIRLLEDSEGNLWAGGLEIGLRVWMTDGNLINPEKGSDVLRPHIMCIFEDRERNILVGTSGGGLARYKPANFHLALGRIGTLAGAFVNTIAAVSPGLVLAGTEGNGLFLIKNGEATTQIVSEDRALGVNQRVTSLIRLRSGRAIAAVASKGLFSIEGTNATAISSPAPVVKLVRSLFEDAGGTLWIGCEEGAFSWKGGVFTQLQAPPLANVRGIAQDSAGVVWFIHDGGLSQLRNGVIAPFPSDLLAGLLLSVTADEKGILWVSVENKGLVRIEQGKPFHYSGEQGLPPASIGAVSFVQNDVWLATEKGLMRTTRDSLHAVAEGRIKRLQYRFFNRGDGLASDLFRRGYQPAVTREEDGRLWFASHKGAVGVRPDRVSRPAYEVPAIIEEIRAEREVITINDANRDDVVIPQGTRHMTIRCSVPTLARPEFMPIEYRLEGQDSRWYTTGNERVIRFYDLAPGSYKFVVRAIGADGKNVDPATSIGFTIKPLLWQRMSFRVLCALAILAVAGFIVRRGVKSRLAVQEARLREQEERAQLEAQLQQASQVEAIGRLAGGIAHDFNNVLTSILGNAELAHMEFGDNPRLAPLLNDIMIAGERARDLVIQILTYSRKRPPSRAPINVAPAIREALALLRSGIPATVQIETNVPDELPPVLADTTQIQRIIVNLGTNAAQAFGPEGGRVYITAQDFLADEEACALQPKLRPGRYVCITVEDNGSGMDDKTLKCIFDPFFTTKGVGKGTGLGLAVVKGIVETHSGIIKVQSDLHKGTNFAIYLPVTSVVSVPRPAPTPLTNLGNRERILVVDDEPAVLNIARRYLELLGYTVDQHTDPHKAIEAFSADPASYHLVITDYSMPGMNGIDLAQRIRSIRKDMPVILCTGFGGALNEAAVQLVGIAQLIHKPYQKEAFAEAISNALAAAKQDKPGATLPRAFSEN